MTTVTRNMSPAQWRTLMALFTYKMHTVRPRLAKIVHDQDVTDGELIELDQADYIEGWLVDASGDGEPCVLTGPVLLSERRNLQIRMTHLGMKVLSSAMGQTLWTLANANRALTIAELFQDNEIGWVDLAAMQKADIITAFSPFENRVNIATVSNSNTTQISVDLTENGKQYLSR